MKSTNNINVVLTNEHIESGFKSLEDNGLNIFHFPIVVGQILKDFYNLLYTPR